MSERAELIIDVEDKASKKLKKIGNTGSKALGSLKKFIGPLIGIAGFAGFAIALKKATDAAKIQEDAENKLSLALRNVGVDINKTLPELKAFASGLQETTKFGDETILEMQSLLVSLGGLKGKGLEDATKATLDLSSALGIDLKAAALLMGKAAAGETSSLTRYGLIIAKGATQAETFENVLSGVNAKFGGAAQAQAKTYSGRMQQVSNSFGDLQEEVGFFLTQSVAVQEIQKQLLSTFKHMINSLKENKDAYGDLVKNGIEKAMQGFLLLIGVAHTISKVFDFMAAAISGAIALILSGVNKIIAIWAILADKLGFDEQAKKAQGLSNEIQGLEQAFGNTAASLINDGGWISQTLDKIGTKTAEVMDKFTQMGETTITPSIGGIESGEKLLPGPTPEQVEVRNFVLEAKELEHLERRFALLTEDQDRELALLDIKHEQELLKLEEKLAKTKEKTAGYDSILAEMANVKEIQDLERKALFQKKKDDIDKKALVDKQKRHKEDAAFIKQLSQVDLQQFENAENRKLAVFNLTRQTMASIAQNLFIAFGKKSKTLFEIAKGANIAQAIMNTYQGATKAFAQYGWPVGAGAAAAVIASGMAQVATIKAQKMAEGGIVTGPTTILAGEAGPEKIIPLDHAEEEGFGRGEGQLIINFNSPILGNEDQAREFAIALDEELYNLKIEGQSLSFA